MAGSAAGADGHHDDEGHGDGDHDGGGWVLVVLLAAVVAFGVAALVIRAVGADGATVASTHVEAAEGAAPSATDPEGQEGAPSTTVTEPAPTTTAAAPTTTAATVGDAATSGSTTPVPAPAAPSARPGGDDADAAESAAAVAFAQAVRGACDLGGVPDPGQVRSTSLGGGLFQIVDANGIVLQFDVATSLVTSADSLDGTVPGGYSESCTAALFGG